MDGTRLAMAPIPMELSLGAIRAGGRSRQGRGGGGGVEVERRLCQYYQLLIVVIYDDVIIVLRIKYLLKILSYYLFQLCL